MANLRKLSLTRSIPTPFGQTELMEEAKTPQK